MSLSRYDSLFRSSSTRVKNASGGIPRASQIEYTALTVGFFSPCSISSRYRLSSQANSAKADFVIFLSFLSASMVLLRAWAKCGNSFILTRYTKSCQKMRAIILKLSSMAATRIPIKRTENVKHHPGVTHTRFPRFGLVRTLTLHAAYDFLPPGCSKHLLRRYPPRKSVGLCVLSRTGFIPNFGRGLTRLAGA